LAVAAVLAAGVGSCKVPEPDCTVVGIVPTAVPEGRVGQEYFFQLRADALGSDCFERPEFALRTGRLPSGMKISKDGAIDGTPSQAGTYSFQVVATVLFSDSSTIGSKDTAQQYSLTILPR
jgi:hypothetical protein